MNALIRLLYALLIAVTTVTFIGVAIYSFYQPPKAPDFPTAYSSSSESESDYKSYDTANKAYQPKEQDYQRNVTYVVLPVAVVVVLIGLYVFKRNEVIGEGVSLGGIATSIYGVITASIADSRPLRFIAVTLLLAGVLVITQRRFLALNTTVTTAVKKEKV